MGLPGFIPGSPGVIYFADTVTDLYGQSLFGKILADAVHSGAAASE